MERNYNNEFERFLKQNADQYRLYPSSGVWKGVYAALHSRRRWVGLGIILLLLTGTGITLLITKSPKKNLVADSNLVAENKTIPQQPEKPQKDVFNINKAIHATRNRNTATNENPDKNSGETILLNPNFANRDGELANDLANNNPVAINQVPVLQSNSIQPEHKTININQNNGLMVSGRPVAPVTRLSSAPVFANISDELTDQDLIPATEKKIPAPQKNTWSGPQQFDWTIESVLNSFKNARQKNKRLNWQLNFTPTISYRKLSENKWFMRRQPQNSSPVYTELYNVNSAVTHKPDMGLEFGLTGKYAVASNFRVKAGLQFNVNRYDIKAFYYPIETATIALNTGGNRVDSIRQATSYRNFNGTKSRWLKNFYFQVSIPVGVEIKIAGDDKVQFGIAGTIQPTYVLGERAYLLTVDYKNYVEVPWLIRRWNANTAFETFVSYSTGKFKWQVGPQVRYQLLSSFVDKYPVKENLFDFGLKVGISLNHP
jgi:hypothetical protein